MHRMEVQAEVLFVLPKSLTRQLKADLKDCAAARHMEAAGNHRAPPGKSSMKKSQKSGHGSLGFDRSMRGRISICAALRCITALE